MCPSWGCLTRDSHIHWGGSMGVSNFMKMEIYRPSLYSPFSSKHASDICAMVQSPIIFPSWGMVINLQGCLCYGMDDYIVYTCHRPCFDRGTSLIWYMELGQWCTCYIHTRHQNGRSLVFASLYDCFLCRCVAGLLMASQARWFQDEPIDPVFEGIAGALNRWTWLPG